MKKLFIVIIASIVTSCRYSPPVKETIYVPVKDTVNEQSNIARIIRLEHDIVLYQDSLRLVRDSLGENLFIANYKLAKIKRYNELAAKGNNIKYLRGWINRALDE
jgi:hypothetical protein|nr:MAG TPA: putative Peptidoglycan domain protein [Crassvirales sp.]